MSDPRLARPRRARPRRTRKCHRFQPSLRGKGKPEWKRVRSRELATIAGQAGQAGQAARAGQAGEGGGSPRIGSGAASANGSALRRHMFGEGSRSRSTSASMSSSLL